MVYPIQNLKLVCWQPLPFAVKKTLLPCRINHNLIIDKQLTERFELIKKSFSTTAASEETTTKIYSHSPNTITLISPLNYPAPYYQPIQHRRRQESH